MESYVSHRKHLYLTVVITSIAYAGCACCFTWTSPTLPKLMAVDSWMPITQEQGSWIASVLLLGGTFGPLLSGKLLDNLGRKWTIIADSLLLFFSWVLVGCATNVTMLYVARFIAGFSTGLMFMSINMYIAEISDDDARKMLSSTMELSLSLGFNLQYFVGPYVSYIHLVIISAAVPLAFIMMFIWIPESPYYLIKKGKKQEAIKSIQWFRGNISLECAEKECVIIESTMYELLKKKESFWKMMKVKGNQKALWITCFLMAAQEFSGINVLQLYSETIFSFTGATLNPAYCAMAFGTFQLLSSSFAAPLTKNFGYKKPLLIACVVITIEQFFVGLFFYLLQVGYDTSSIGWVPITCFILYILTYSATFGPLPWAVLGEIFPTNVKATASSVVASFTFFITFVICKLFTNVSALFGMYTSFWIFSVSMILSFFVILVYQPETKGMSLQEIQDKLNRNKNKIRNPVTISAISAA